MLQPRDDFNIYLNAHNTGTRAPRRNKRTLLKNNKRNFNISIEHRTQNTEQNILLITNS